MAARRPGRRPGLPLQIQRGGSHRLLGAVFSVVGSGAGASQKKPAVSLPADFRALHAAGNHLEFAKRLDHPPPRRRQRWHTVRMAPDVAAFPEFLLSGNGIVEPGFLCRSIMGHGGVPETPPRESTGTLFLLPGRIGLSGT